MSEETRYFALALFSVLALILLLFSVRISLAHDMDHPEFDEWYAGLMQPDNPTVPCCGISDAYWCDTWYTRDGKTYCKITDDRDDEHLKNRHHVDVGTEIYIPDSKYKWDKQNPTGHVVVFLSYSNQVYCFVQNGGV